MMAIVISGAVSSQTVQGSVDDGFVIKAGNVTMTVSAKEGGKIMSYKYDDKEMLSQQTSMEALSGQVPRKSGTGHR